MTAIFERVQKSFERQGMMQHLDARLVKVEHGLVELVLPYSDKVTQQQDGFHGGAMKAVAGSQKIKLPAEVSITADVSIGPMTGKAGAFGISVAMAISVPGMDGTASEALVKAANEVCPYSNATRGNIDVSLTVV